MTGNFVSNQIKRDKKFTQGLWANSRTFLLDWEAWAQVELTELITAHDLREATEGDGPLKEVIQGTIRRLREINLVDLPQAIKKYEELLDDINDDEADNVFDACQLLAQAQHDLVLLGRAVLRIRDDFLKIAE